MTGKVIYLNAWLDCSDDELRKNYRMQERINLAKARFFYEIREKGIYGYQAQLCYDRWVHANRDRMKLEGHEVDTNVDDTDPAS